MKAAASLVFLIAVVGIGVFGVGPPRPVAADAPAEVFSSGRAFELLEQIAAEPHPAGSPAAGRVRDLIGARAAELGYPSEVQSWSERERELVNLLVRVPGQGSTGVVLFACHYDAVPASHGAGDDGAAVVAFLEVLRALKTAPPLRNDLVFLFSDGEELGLLGARRFRAEHRWFGEVSVVFNFEGRGLGGAAILFETGPRNGLLIEEFARVAPHPVGSSMGPSVYDNLPNDTDFTPFKNAGLPGLNFAFIAGGSGYHRPADRADNLAQSSLQHHGTNVLALARHFGERELTGLDGRRDATFLTLPGNWMLTYSSRWNLPVALLAALLCAVATLRGLRRRAFGAGTWALGILLAPLYAAAIATLCFGTWWLLARGVEWASASLGWFAQAEARGNILSSRIGLLGVVATVLLLNACALPRLGARWIDALTAAGLLWWTALAAATLAWAEGASHIFAWPVVFASIGLMLSSGTRPNGSRSSGWPLGLLAIPSLWVLLPVAGFLYDVGSVRVPEAVVFSASVLALSSLVLLGPMERLVQSGRKSVWITSGACALALLVGASLLAVAGR